MQSKQRQTGLTMIELMIVVTIAGILTAIAAPSFSSFIADTRLTSTMSQLTADLNHARSEAIKRNSWVLVCVRGTDIDCGAGTDWANGWLVCQDSEPNGVCDGGSAANPNPITVHPAVTNFTLTGSAASFRFNPNGTALAVSSLRIFSGAKSRTAHIAVTGNVSTSNP